MYGAVDMLSIDNNVAIIVDVNQRIISNLDILSLYNIWHQRFYCTSCWTRCFGHHECSPLTTREYVDFPITGSDKPGIVEFNDTKEKQKYMAAVDQSNLDHVSSSSYLFPNLSLSLTLISS